MFGGEKKDIGKWVEKEVIKIIDFLDWNML